MSDGQPANLWSIDVIYLILSDKSGFSLSCLCCVIVFEALLIVLL